MARTKKPTKKPTKNPELVATARNIARSVPDRIVAIAFLDGCDGGAPEVVELVDEEPSLTGAEVDGQEMPRLSKSFPSS
jgi:hypothetical protein